MLQVEGKFGTGAVIEKQHRKDVLYTSVASVARVDWIRGYSVGVELGGFIPVKNQKNTLSCVGQSLAYYSWVLSMADLVKRTGLTLTELRASQPHLTVEHSAKSIYSQIYIPYGGASLTRGAKTLIKWGILTEKVCPSQNGAEELTEAFMDDDTWKNDITSWEAKKLREKGFAYIYPTAPGRSVDMETVAHAIQNNWGCILIISGNNNGTWLTTEPKPPANESELWAHAIWCGGFGNDSKGRYIFTPNSWGDLGGWQKIREDYFNTRLVSAALVIVDKPDDTMVNLYRQGLDPRPLPLIETAQIKGFLESGFSFKKI